MLDSVSLRSQISALKPEEAVELLLGMLDGEQDSPVDKVALLLEMATSKISKRNAALLVYFWDHLGKYCRSDEVDEFLTRAAGKDVTGEARRTAVKHVRAFIKEEGYPVALETVYGVGHRLRRLDQCFELFPVKDHLQAMSLHSAEERVCVPFGSHMKGDVNAAVVEISGQLTGDIVANSLIMHSGSRLVGSARIRHLRVEPEVDLQFASLVTSR